MDHAIALEEIKRNSTNTTLVGAFAATTNWVKLESLEKALAKFFPPKTLDGNIRCARRGFNEVKLLKY